MIRPTDLADYRRRLMELMGRVAGEQHHVEEETLGATDAEAAGGAGNRPQHAAECSSHASEQEVAAELLASEEYLLEEAAAALERLDEGTYGWCEGCGAEIQRARLRAVPYARQCIACSRKSSPGTA